MVNPAPNSSDEKEFWENVDTQFEEKVQDFLKL